MPYGRYYGSVDATPLFLVLLHAHAEATGDPRLARRLEPQARAAVEWMFRDGGLNDRGYLVYTSDVAAGGLANQNWKDSAGRDLLRRRHPGHRRRRGRRSAGLRLRRAAPHRAPGRAGLGRHRPTPAVWSRPRTTCGSGSRGTSGCADADFPALALDGAGRQVDALASDAGHLLWSGILDQDRAERVGRRLLEPDFFSGWGIRTLAEGQVPYHPLSYHRGSVWPHDNAVIALGLARHGLTAEARTVAAALTDAARHHGWRLPEVLSGYGRDRHPEPVPYPHACSPQAWAAATPLALLTAVGGGSGT